MPRVLTQALVLLASLAVVLASPVTVKKPVSTHTLPIFFFHGVTANAQIAFNLQQNLSTDARPFIALTFCQDSCSLRDLRVQTNLAIDQIRSITANDSRFDQGYVFIGHSQGGALARSVIENMDDHKVHTFISLAGAVNGIFYGPQESDFIPGKVFRDAFSPIMVDPKLLDFSNYTDDEIRNGKMQIDLIKLHVAHPELQAEGSGYQLNRSPAKSLWITYNTFFAVINNLQTPVDTKVFWDQLRRKRNFLKLKAAHFFASPRDEVISPWQSSILGQYNDLSSMDELEKSYSQLKVIPMVETDEYKKDTYGLRTLNQCGGLFLHVVENVGHVCWVVDSVPFGATEECKFRPVYEKTLYPLLSPA